MDKLEQQRQVYKFISDNLQTNADAPFERESGQMVGLNVTYEKIRELRVRVQRNRDKNIQRLTKLMNKNIRTLDEDVCEQLKDLKADAENSHSQWVHKIQALFEVVKAPDKELDTLISNIYHAKKNSEAVLAIIGDFVNID